MQFKLGIWLPQPTMFRKRMKLYDQCLIFVQVMGPIDQTATLYDMRGHFSNHIFLHEHEDIFWIQHMSNFIVLTYFSSSPLGCYPFPFERSQRSNKKIVITKSNQAVFASISNIYISTYYEHVLDWVWQCEAQSLLASMYSLK